MATPATVWGARCKGWWLANTTGTPVSQWTAETGPNMIGDVSNQEPSTSTTPASQKSLVFQAPDGVNNDYLYAASTSWGFGTTSGKSFQLVFALKVAIGTSGTSYVAHVDSDAGTIRAWLTWTGSGAYLTAETYLAAGGAVNKTTHASVPVGWSDIVIDITTAGVMSIYVAGVLGSDPITLGSSSVSGVLESPYLGAGHTGTVGVGEYDGLGSGGQAIEICSPAVANDASNFSAGDIAAIHAVLLAYIAAPAAIGNGSMSMRMGLGL